MCAWLIPPVTGLIEPAVAPEYFIGDIGGIELIGACVRVYFYVEQMPLETKGEIQRIVNLKIVRPIAGIPEAIATLAQCLCGERTPKVQVGGQWPRVVR